MFDAIAAIEAAKLERDLRKSRHYKKRTSKLEKHRFEIVHMFNNNSSLASIVIHLQTHHKLSVSRSTVLRYLKSIGMK